MRKVTFGAASSLDNFIARKDHAVDWLMWSKDAARVMTAYWKTIDTILMGRKTYEVAKAMNGEVPTHAGMKTYVFSRTLSESTPKGVEIINTDAIEFVRELKRQEGKDICLMGGGEFAKPLFEAGLVDEVGFNIHPVLLGSGIPLFLEMKRQINLELINCETFSNGCVMVSYRVKNQKPERRSRKKS